MDKAKDSNEVAHNAKAIAPHEEPTVPPVNRIAEGQISKESQDKTGQRKEDADESSYGPNPIESLRHIWDFLIEPKNSSAIQAVCTLLIFVTGMIYTVFAGLQWCASKKAADAAKSAAETTRNAFGMDKRRAEEIEEAKCTILGDIGIGERFYTVTIPNGGKVSARDMRAHIEISLNALPSNKRIRLIKVLDIFQPELAANRPIEKMIDLSLTPQEWEGIIQTRKGLVETGTIQYENGFDRIVDNSVCRVLAAVPSPDDPLNRAHGSVPDCDRLQQFLSTMAKPK